MLSLSSWAALQTEAAPAIQAVEAELSWLERLEGLAVEYAPGAAGAVLTLFLGWIGVRILVRIIDRALVRARLDATLARFLSNVLRLGFLTLLVLMVLPMVGVPTTSFVAILGAAGFAVGFALKDSLGNFAAGVMIMIFRPFKVGDTIEAAGTAGTVEEVGVFATVIRTADNRQVIVSNTAITGGNITNVSAYPTRRVDMVFAISYADDVDQARAILEDILAQDRRVLDEPAAVVAVDQLGERGVHFVCRPWTANAEYWNVYWDTCEAVKKRFDTAGIRIPFPQRDVHVHQAGGRAAV